MRYITLTTLLLLALPRLQAQLDTIHPLANQYLWTEIGLTDWGKAVPGSLYGEVDVLTIAILKSFQLTLTTQFDQSFTHDPQLPQELRAIVTSAQQLTRSKSGIFTLSLAGYDMPVLSGKDFYADLSWKLQGGLKNLGSLSPSPELLTTADNPLYAAAGGYFRANLAVKRGSFMTRKKEREVQQDEKMLLSLACNVMATQLFLDDNHEFYQAFTDDRGNPAAALGLNFDLRMGLLIDGIVLTAGYAGRTSIGSPVNDAKIWGLEPKLYFTFATALY